MLSNAKDSGFKLLFASRQGHIEYIFVGSLCIYILRLSLSKSYLVNLALEFFYSSTHCTIADDEIPNCALQQNMFSRVQQQALVHDTCEVNIVVLSLQDKIYTVYN
jgi:hypothetical protein